jgi:V/A-type H+-transporting ATPase subunit I
MMYMNISPVKMAVAKLATRRDLDRQLLLTLEEFGLFEPIDIRQQITIQEPKKTREEESVIILYGQLTEMINSLGLDVNCRTSQRIPITDGELADSLLHAREVVKAVRAEILDIDKEIKLTKQELEIALSLEILGVDLSEIGPTDYSFTIAGTISSNSLNKLQWNLREVTDGAVVMASAPLKSDMTLLSISVPVDRKETVERILNLMEFKSFRIPEGYRPPPRALETTADITVSQLEDELERLNQLKDSISRDWGPRLLGAWEVLDIERQRMELKTYFAYTEETAKVWGWIPEGTQELLEDILRQNTSGQYLIEFEIPDFAEYDSPSYIQNPSVFKPAQGVVSAFGTPSKLDLDPTKILFFTFPLIFGLIFADIGQGFLILIIGLVALRAKRREIVWDGVLNYVQIGAEGLIMMGLFSMLAGFIFGSFFGAETVFEPIWPIMAHNLENGEVNPYRTAHLLKLSLEVGSIHIILGILLNLIAKIKHHQLREMIVVISYMWMYLGFINLLFGVSYTNINNWFSLTGSVNLWIPIVGIGYGVGNNGIYPALPLSPLIFTLAVFLIPFVLMAISSFMGGMEGTVMFMEYGLSTISHTISYARIFALNIVHTILSSIFLSLPAIIDIPFPPVSIFGVVFIPQKIWHNGYLVTPYLPLLGAVIGTIIVGLLEGIIAFMHTLRLHYVEWFSKFFHAGGVPFKPFQIQRIHTVSTAKLPNIPKQKVSYDLS